MASNEDYLYVVLATNLLALLAMFNRVKCSPPHIAVVDNARPPLARLRAQRYTMKTT